MKTLLNKYSLRLVREADVKYNSKPIKQASDAIEIARKLLIEAYDLENQAEEITVVACLDAKNQISGLFEVSRGIVNSAQVHPREIFKRALLCNAVSIIFMHNHPSGNCEPSKQDDDVTKKLKEAGQFMGIPLLDSIIIGDDCYYSYNESRNIL